MNREAKSVEMGDRLEGLFRALKFSKERARLLRSTKDREDEERFQETIKKKILDLTK